MRNYAARGRTGDKIYLLAFGLAVLFLPVLLIVAKVLKYTHGIFMYPFDDTFIHLTIADHLLKGNWGINSSEFASASSSILYTIILAIFRIFSKSDLVPFLVNCLAGIAILFSLHWWMKKHGVSYLTQAAVFLFTVFFAPLPLLIVSGMEHTLQCLFSFLFIFYCSDWLEQNCERRTGNVPLRILVFGLLVTTIRYEGVFLVAIAGSILFIRGQIRQALILGAVSIAPLIIFGFISIAHGNYFFPNSVLVKSSTFGFESPLQILYDILFERLVFARNGMAAIATQRLTIILPLLLLLFRRSIRPAYLFILIFLALAAVLQLSFASTGYLYRYEAYLFFCSWVILPVIFTQCGKSLLADLRSWVSRIAALALVFFLFFPVVLRSITALQKAPQACINIFDQQYQMAEFTKLNFDQQAVALNDIGAVGYYTNANIVDLWGLASIQVTRSKRQHYWTPQFLDSLCRSERVQIAIIYDSWFPEALTKHWSKLASWEIRNNVICGDSVVSFYAIDASQKLIMRQRLEAFSAQLSPTIGVRYY